MMAGKQSYKINLSYVSEAKSMYFYRVLTVTFVNSQCLMLNAGSAVH